MSAFARWRRGPDGLALLAGLLWALAFPKWGLAGLAWVAPGLLLIAAADPSPRARFGRGYLGGLMFFLTSLYWLLCIPFPAGAILGWLALSAYLSIYPAFWAAISWAAWDFCARPNPANHSESGRPLPGAPSDWRTLFDWPGALFDAGWARRLTWTLFCAAAWVGLEWVQSRFLSGFPWNLLGASQYRLLPLIQAARWAGVYGVSFLIAWFSVSFVAALLMWSARGARTGFWNSDLAVPLGVIALCVAGGAREILKPPPKPARTVRLALIQPSIPQNLIWDPAANSNRFERLIALSQRALQSHPDVLIWPEAALPNMLRYDPETFYGVMGLIESNHVWMILGSDDMAPRPGAAKDEVDYYNSAFALSPDGKLAGVYRKRQLVIFGEYVPLAGWLPFLTKLIPAGEGFAAGHAPVTFHLTALGVNTSVLICFEDVFTNLARSAAQNDVDFLLNLTNNGWFDESAAQWQHAANAVFRAVENGMPLVRCTNNGLTCWIDPHGGMRQIYFPGSRNIYQEGYKIVNLSLPPRSSRPVTFYRRHGDWFAWTCFATLIAGGAACLRRSRRARQRGIP